MKIFASFHSIGTCSARIRSLSMGCSDLYVRRSTRLSRASSKSSFKPARSRRLLWPSNSTRISMSLSSVISPLTMDPKKAARRIPFCCKISRTVSWTARICSFINLEIFNAWAQSFSLASMDSFSERNLSVRVNIKKCANRKRANRRAENMTRRFIMQIGPKDQIMRRRFLRAEEEAPSFPGPAQGEFDTALVIEGEETQKAVGPESAVGLAFSCKSSR